MHKRSELFWSLCLVALVGGLAGYPSQSRAQGGLFGGNIVPALVQAQTAASALPTKNGSMEAYQMAGTVSAERKERLVKDLTQVLPGSPKDGTYRVIIIEDQSVAVDIFTQALSNQADQSLSGIKLAFVGREKEKQALLDLAAKKGAELVYAVRE